MKKLHLIHVLASEEHYDINGLDFEMMLDSLGIQEDDYGIRGWTITEREVRLLLEDLDHTSSDFDKKEEFLKGLLEIIQRDGHGKDRRKFIRLVNDSY